MCWYYVNHAIVLHASELAGVVVRVLVLKNELTKTREWRSEAIQQNEDHFRVSSNVHLLLTML